MRVLLLAATLWMIPAFSQAPPAPAKPKPAPPPARIREFKASAVTLQPGQSTTLSWQVENPTTTSRVTAAVRRDQRALVLSLQAPPFAHRVSSQSPAVTAILLTIMFAPDPAAPTLPWVNALVVVAGFG